MIQTKVFITSFKGLNFDIVPKQIKRPSGIEKRSVKKKSPQVILKPSRSVRVTFQKLINLSKKSPQVTLKPSRRVNVTFQKLI